MFSNLSALAGICGQPEEEILRTAKIVKDCMLAIKPLSMVKTLDFAEATAFFSLFTKDAYNSLRLLELGTQYGVSTRLAHDVLVAKGITPLIRTYDIDALPHCFAPHQVDFRHEDITGRCEAVLDEFRPQAVFLDAHPWVLTLEMTSAARQRRLLILMHDVGDLLWRERLLNGKLPIVGHECDPDIPWERKVLEQLFGPGIHCHHHLTEDYCIDIVDSCFGLAICQPRREASNRPTTD